MPFELQPGEMVLFPAPFIPTERHLLIITNRRVVQYAPEGPYPVSEFELSKIEFIGRMSERPALPLAIALAAVGLLLFIVGGIKVLPPILTAGVQKSEQKEAEETTDGRLVEGKDSDDDFPFYDKEIESRSIKNKANKLKRLKDGIKPGIPPFSFDLGLGIGLWVLSAGFLYGGNVLRKREEFWIFCRAEGAVHKIPAQSEMNQSVVLQTLQAAQQAMPKT